MKRRYFFKNNVHMTEVICDVEEGGILSKRQIRKIAWHLCGRPYCKCSKTGLRGMQNRDARELFEQSVEHYKIGG